jgi:hypothetical protein
VKDDQRADPLVRSARVDLSTGLINQLHQLAGSVGADDHELGTSLEALVADLAVAVSSYCGLQLTITQQGFPVVLTAFAESDGAVATSLRVPLSLLDPALEVHSRVVFYARTPGAFVDLAADLAYALRKMTVAVEGESSDGQGGDGLGRDDGRRGDGWQHGADHRGDGRQQADGHLSRIELDADLPPLTRDSGISGLADLSTINHAVGVLIANGHHPDDAHDTLRRQAAASGLTPHALAARMLRK